jgi:hypothetical protein
MAMTAAQPAIEDIAGLFFKATVCADCAAALTARARAQVDDILTSLGPTLAIGVGVCDHCRGHRTLYGMQPAFQRRRPLVEPQ